MLTPNIRLGLIVGQVILGTFGIIGNITCFSAFCHPLLICSHSGGVSVLVSGIIITDILICILVPLVEWLKLVLCGLHTSETGVEATDTYDPLGLYTHKYSWSPHDKHAEIAASFTPESRSRVEIGCLLDLFMSGSTPPVDTDYDIVSDYPDPQMSESSFNYNDTLRHMFVYSYTIQLLVLCVSAFLVCFLCVERLFAVTAWVKNRHLVGRVAGILLGIFAVSFAYLLAIPLVSPFGLFLLPSDNVEQRSIHNGGDFLFFHVEFLQPIIWHVMPIAIIILIWTAILFTLGCNKVARACGCGGRRSPKGSNPLSEFSDPFRRSDIALISGRSSSMASSDGFPYKVHRDVMTIAAWTCFGYVLTGALGAVIVSFDITYKVGGPSMIPFYESNVEIFQVCAHVVPLLIVLNAAWKPLLFLAASVRVRRALTDVCMCKRRWCRRRSNSPPLGGYSRDLQLRQQQLQHEYGHGGYGVRR